MELDPILTLQKVAVLFFLIVIGFIAGKSGLISKEGQRDITQLVLYITMPATIFTAMQLEMSQERLHTSFVIIGIMICCYLFMFTAGFLVSRSLPLNPGQKDIFQTALLLSNTSFMGYPMVQSLLGSDALFYAVVGAGFLFEMVAWSLGVYLIARHGKVEASFNWKKVVFSPGILSIIVGLVFFFFQWPVPEPANSLINMMAPATSPLAMIVVGLMLSRSDILAALKNKILYLSAGMKLLVVPLIVLAVLKALGFSNETLVIPVMMISMPTASYVAMFSGNYENDANFASQIVFMASLLSVITIPIVTLFF